MKIGEDGKQPNPHPTPRLNARGLFEPYLHEGKKITEVARYKRLRNVYYTRVWLYELSRYAYFLTGLAEVFFLAALSIVGERENIRFHVIFFYIFGFCGIGFFISNIFCHAHSLYYLNPYGRLSYNLKLLFSTLYILSVPVLMGSFFLYWKQCITWAYDVFAICEYTGVFLNICFHGCAFFDIRYKVTFSVRLVEPAGDTSTLSSAPSSSSSPLPLPTISEQLKKRERTS